MAPRPKPLTPEVQEAKRLRRQEQNRLAQLRLRQRRRGDLLAEPGAGHVPPIVTTNPSDLSTNAVSPPEVVPVINANSSSSALPLLSDHPPSPALSNATDPAMLSGRSGPFDFLDRLLFPSHEQSTGTPASTLSDRSQDLATAPPAVISDDMWAQLIDLPVSAPTPSPVTQVPTEPPLAPPIPAVIPSSETPQTGAPVQSMDLYAALAAGVGTSVPGGGPQVHEPPSDTGIDLNSLLLAQGTQPMVDPSPNAAWTLAPFGPISAPTPAPLLTASVTHEPYSTNAQPEAEVHTVARRSQDSDIT